MMSALSSLRQFDRIALGIFFLCVVPVCMRGQPPAAPPSLQALYDRAQGLQTSGDLEQAAQAYKDFLVAASLRLAENHARAGDYTGAKSLFDSAVSLAPHNIPARLAYAEAARNAGQLAPARTLAQQIVDQDPSNSSAHRMLGRIFLDLNEGAKAREQFEAAVALDPSYPNGYALATAELALQDTKAAARLFSEMLAGFGDTAALHMDFGLAYGKSDYPDQAIPEFKAAIAKDPKLPGAHYSLGASYLLARGDVAIPDAAEEFRKELEIQPDDYFSVAQLGAIALKAQRLGEAETDLVRATRLNPSNPDNFLLLGEVYSDLGRLANAETSLKRSIELTTDLSRNHYQVQRAHYLLGRILIRTGRMGEARKEMETSQSLLQQNIVLDHARLQGLSTVDLIGKGPISNKADPSQLNAGALQAVSDYQHQLAPAIADSYNNVAVTAARDGDFKTAIVLFEHAALWNPGLDGLDYNWARAAYSSGEYARAIPPLRRYLDQRASDPWARSALGISLFMTGDYAGVVEIAKPVALSLDKDPPLAYAYADSLARTGHYEEGIARLKILTAAAPDVAVTHRALGAALLARAEYNAAETEFRTALRLSPADTDAQYQLALTLIHLARNTQAETLLNQLVHAHHSNADVLYQLGKLKLARGEVRSATLDFEAAVPVSPESAAIHEQLLQVYRQQSRSTDADREIQRYQAVLDRHPSLKPVSQ